MPEDRRTSKTLVVLCLVVIAAGIGLYFFGRSIWMPFYYRFAGRRTIEEVISQYGPEAEKRLAPYFHAAKVSFPPDGITLIGLKKERKLEVWAKQGSSNVLIREYPILAASGGPGPKLKEGDRQVPEGIYQIESLNPASSYHLSMKVSYPNSFELEKARVEGRTNLGGDIFIHGKAVSIGCLAMGDPAIEELFLLAHKVGIKNIRVLILPWDFRVTPATKGEMKTPPWIAELYSSLQNEVGTFKPPR